MAVATAYISDITVEEERARRFGYMSACFGLGFIIGPVLGGLLGAHWLRAPFLAAAVLNATTLVLAYLLLPESRKATTVTPFKLASLNPLGPMRWAFGLEPLVPLFLMFGLFGLVGNIPGTVWVLYGQDKFHWDNVTVGLSLATFGLCHAGSQALFVGPITERFGEMRTIVIGIVFDGAAFVLIGLATQGWVAFALAPFFALGGVGLPALQSLTTQRVADDKQGELQGVLASIVSLTAIVGPLVGTALYASTKQVWIGAVWILGAALYLLMIPLLMAVRRGVVRGAAAPG
jgi:DHA1 family tetracycline resistance protein-like MFS transporter